MSRLRAVLGPDAIAGDRQGWRFVAGARVEVDLDEAERLAGEAEARLGGEPALALAAAERALALVGRGPFLADEPDADWAMAARPRGRSAWPPGPGGSPGRPPWPSVTRPAPWPTPAPPPPPTPWTSPPGAPSCAPTPPPASPPPPWPPTSASARPSASELGTDPSPETQALHLARPPRRPGRWRAEEADAAPHHRSRADPRWGRSGRGWRR